MSVAIRNRDMFTSDTFMSGGCSIGYAGRMPHEGVGQHEVARQKYGRIFGHVVGERRRFGLSDRAGVHVLYSGDLSANDNFWKQK